MRGSSALDLKTNVIDYLSEMFEAGKDIIILGHTLCPVLSHLRGSLA